jgi:predicted DNA binding CopG/RHH family protein
MGVLGTQFLLDTVPERIKFPNLKPSTESISLRLPISLLEGLKIKANKRDVPYQSLLKTWFAEKLEEVSK